MMPTPRDARKAVRDLRIVTPESLPNEAVIARYLDYQQHVAARPWRPSTQLMRVPQLRLLADQLAPVSLVHATEDDIADWYTRLSCGRSSRASLLSAARGLYHWMAVKCRPRLRGDDPTMILERPRLPQGKPRPMADRYYDLALACAVSDPELYLWLGLMGCSGLRCCEVAWMQVGDVEQLESGAGLLHLVGKGGKRRIVPAGDMLMLTMRPFLRGRGPVFTRPSDGGPHTPGGVSKRVNKFLADVGVPAPQRAHSLRHRFGTDYHALDVDLYRQATLMGHGSVDTTQLYTEVSPVEAARYIEQLTNRRLRRPHHPDRKGRAA